MNWDLDAQKTRIKITPANQAEVDLLKKIIDDGYDEVTITVQTNHKQEIMALFLWKKNSPIILNIKL
jgi:phosphatidate phosphatase PAH1